MTDREKPPTFSPDYIRDLSEKVYRDRLGVAQVASMIRDDKDSGEKLRGRAASYDPLTRCFLKAIGIEPGADGKGKLSI